MLPALGYAAHSAGSPLAPWKFERREPRDTDVVLDIQYCGVCHSDVHMARGEWGGEAFPLVPGHEIVGRVSKVGAKVKRFKPGDTVGVGCMVNSCRTCASCQEGLEQYCTVGATFTYNSVEPDTGKPTYGGYSSNIVVDETFVLSVSPKLELSRVAPLLCAGITTWSPLRHWKIGKGHEVAIVGLGGLGHMGVKLARALGAKVTVFTTSPGKRADALKLGAHAVVVSSDAGAMKGAVARFDFILDTVSAPHPLTPYLSTLKRDGTLCLVGLPVEAPTIDPFTVVGKRRSIAGSLIGGIRETQEMLDFCAEHEVVSDVEVIPIQKINEAYERMLRSDVKYRFVIDMKTIAR